MEPTTTLITHAERTFFYFTLLGLLIYTYKKFHAWPNWNVGSFLKANGNSLLGSLLLCLGIGWFAPDLFLVGYEKYELASMLQKYPRLMEKATYTFGVVLGITGGTIGFELAALLYNIPYIGPFIKTVVDKLRDMVGVA